MIEEITMLDRPANSSLAEWPGYVVAFYEAMTDAIDGISKAADIYVKAIDEDPERAKEFRAACPKIHERTWSQFERIGRKHVDVRLVVEKVAHKSRIERLPFQEQKRLLDGEPVDLLVHDDETADVLKVDARTATTDQAAQLFAGDHVRTLSEQKAWLVDRERKAKLTSGDSAETLPYVIHGNKVTFKKHLTMTLRELKDLIQIMAS